MIILSADMDELLLMAEDGDHRKVDSLVCDIYGMNYNEQLLGLPPDLIAGSFGKCSNPDFANLIKTDPDYRKVMLIFTTFSSKMYVYRKNHR